MTDVQMVTLSTYYGVSEDLAAKAFALGITFDDISGWISKYGVGVVALFREVVEDYRTGKLHGWGAAWLVLGYWRKYGHGVVSFLDELFAKLGLDRAQPGPGDGIAG